eukprot:926930-Alexandrium_andersonii.AAC.1
MGAEPVALRWDAGGAGDCGYRCLAAALLLGDPGRLAQGSPCLRAFVESCATGLPSAPWLPLSRCAARLRRTLADFVAARPENFRELADACVALAGLARPGALSWPAYFSQTRRENTFIDGVAVVAA